mgnify:CR=1 FL=1
MKDSTDKSKEHEGSNEKPVFVFVRNPLPDDNRKITDGRPDLTPDGYKWYDCM